MVEPLPITSGMTDLLAIIVRSASPLFRAAPGMIIRSGIGNIDNRPESEP